MMVWRPKTVPGSGSQPMVSSRGGREAADRARYAAISVVDLLEGRRVSAGDVAVSLLQLLELIEHAKRENPGMWGSDLLPKAGPSVERRLVEMLLRGVLQPEARRSGGGGQR